MANTQVTLGGTAFLQVNGEPIVLTTKSLHPSEVRLVYRAESFQEAANLGSIENAVVEINKKLNGLSIDTTTITDAVSKAKAVVPGLEAMLTADIMLTDLVIDSPGKQYVFGIGMNFSQLPNPPRIGSVQLDGFAILLTIKGEA